MPQSLPRQLIIIILLGTVLLTLLLVGLSARGLVAVRNQATSGSSEALQEQAEQYLLRVAQGQANSTSQTVKAVQQLAVTTRSYLQQPASGQAALPELQVARNGRRYANGNTTMIAIASSDERQANAELISGQRMEEVLPTLQITVPEIVRISYLTASTLRTYPNIAPSDLPEDWTPAQEPAYQISLPEDNPSGALAWTTIHPSISQFGQTEPIISSVAPIYDGTTLRGTVSVDVSLDRLTAYLNGLMIDQTGFAFLINNEGEVVAVTKEGQAILPPNLKANPSDPVAAALQPMLADIPAGRNGVAAIALRDRGYVLAYAPISGIDWGLGLASPLDEITARTDGTATKIAAITSQSLALGVGLAAIAAVLFGVGMTMLLRRQFARPLDALIHATDEIAAGHLQPIAVANTNELGKLATSFNTMTTALQAARAETEAKEAARESAMQELSLAVGNLEQSLAERQQLFQLLKEVSSPVIPVIKGVLVMPLIGTLDQDRIDGAMHSLLKQVEREHARTVLIDITGVPMLDSQAAYGLMKMMGSLKLLGANVVLVGVAPEVAQTLTALDIAMTNIQTAANLRTAVERLIK